MSDSDICLDIQDIKRDRSRSPLGDDSDRNRRRMGMDRKSNNKPRGRRAPDSHRVHVSNIPYEYKWQDLKDLFRNEIGEVNYVEMYKDDSGRPRGCGVIEFESAELAQKAIDNLHRYELNGRKLVVKKQDPETDREMRRKDMGGRSMNSGGGNFGNPGRMGMGDMGPPSGGPGNFGNTYGLSVVFLESLGINGPLGTKVFVANLDYKVDDDMLRDVFKIAGKVTRAELSKDPESGKSRGFGVVEYDHPVEAVQAISMLHGQWYHDRKLSVRMDRIQDKKAVDPVSSSKLPAGLKGLGMGLGMNGLPLTDVTTINSNTQSVANPNLTAGMGMGGMGGGNMGLGNANMLQNLTNMASLNPMGASNMAGGMGGMNAGLMGMANPVDSQMGNSMLSSNSMMGGNMLGSQVTSMNRLGFQGSNFNNSDSMTSNTNFSNNYGGNSGGNVVQISNLPLETTWQNLRDLCREYGEIRFAEIRRKGTGAVRFANESDARMAVGMLDRQRFSGRLLEARIL